MLHPPRRDYSPIFLADGCFLTLSLGGRRTFKKKDDRLC